MEFNQGDIMKFKEGDRVEFIRDYGDIKKGARGKCHGYIKDMIWVRLDKGDATSIGGEQYLELIEDIDKREQAIYARMAKVKRPKLKEFKVGARVKAINECFLKSLVGEKGTICRIMNNELGVYFDKDIGAHSCDGGAERGHGLYLSKNQLELI